MNSITKEIGIDAAHRVPLHQSKCRSMHGHRYVIYMEISGELFQEGPQSNMVLDYGFMKDLMMTYIDAYCDHGIILASDDEKFLTMAHNKNLNEITDWFCTIQESIKQTGFWAGETLFGKTYIINGAPTAENLAQHWFKRLAPAVLKATNGQAKLTAIIVKETPTSIATYQEN